MGVLVRILGPTALEVDGCDVDITRQQARVLAALAARSPGAVPRDLVIDALWGERPPASAVNGVQVLVSGLRKVAANAGASETLVAPARGGYRLGETVDVDAVLLRQAVRSALAAASGRSAAERVRAWDDHRFADRGVPLPELEDVGAYADIRAELSALAQQARTLRWEEFLVAGQAALVVTELVSVLTADPTNERGISVLARAQYLMGRQVDALQTLAAHRSVMASEFGLDPSPAVIELERRILLQDPGLTPHERAPLVAIKAEPWDDWPLGRDDLVDQTLALLLTGSGLVTLVGPGGVGKTTLANAIARRVQEHEMARPVVMVATASWPPDTDILAGFARAVGPIDQIDSYAAAIAAVRSTGAVVVLDNLEHLNGAAEAVSTIVEDLRGPVLATSRHPVGVPAEHVVPVPMLDARADGPAVELFARAARRSGYAGNESELTELGSLVAEHVGGLPLGMELAASWLRVLDPGAIRDRLGLSTFETTAGAVPARQRSLARIIDDALGFMIPSQIRLFARLSLCPGGARLAVVDALVAVDVDATGSAAHSLRALIDAGLVRSVADADDAFRYELLPAVREHASKRLNEQGPEHVAAAQVAWSRAMADLVTELGPQVRSPKGLAIRQVLRREFPHVRAVVAYLVEHEQAEMAAETVLWLRNFAELESRVEDLCALQELVLVEQLPPPSRIRLLNSLALMYPRLDRAEDAQRAAETALELAVKLGDPVLTGRLHTTVAGLLVEAQRLGDAEEHLEAAEAFRAADNDVLGMALVRTHRGLALLGERRYDDAVDALRSALDVPGLDEFPDAAATASYNVALALAMNGELVDSANQLLGVLGDVLAMEEQEMVGYIAVAAAVAVGVRRPYACASMAGLALTVLRRLGEELEGVEATALDEAIASARREIGDASFARAFADGAAVPPDGIGARIERELVATLST